MNKMLQKSLHILLLFLIVLGVLISCEPAGDNVVVAKAGQRDIQWQELYLSYNLDPKWGKGLTNEQSFRNQLDYLIDEKIFAQQAEQENLVAGDGDLAGHLEFLEEKELIRALYRQEVKSKIQISDAEYQQAYEYSKITLRYQFVETPDSTRAQDYLARLQKSTVDEILLIDPASERKGESPMVKIGDVDEQIEQAVFPLKLNETAGPVKVGASWYALKVVEGSRELFRSKLDFAENKSKIDQILFDRKAAGVSAAYIRSIMQDKNVRLNPEIFGLVLRHFSRIASSIEGTMPEPVQIPDRELRRVQSSLVDNLDQPVVFFAGESMTVGEFLQQLLNMPAGLRPKVNMAQDLKVAIGRVVRNRYLVEEARRRGLDKDEEVRELVRREQDKVLARTWLRKLQRGVTVSEEEVARFRESEQFAYLEQRLGHEPEEQFVRDIVWDLRFSELRHQEAQRLRGQFAFKVFDKKLLEKIENPGAIIKQDPVGFSYREEFF
jgi:hypothetical protein